jgi:serine protease AprX
MAGRIMVNDKKNRWGARALFAAALIALAISFGRISPAPAANIDGSVHAWANSHPGQPVPLIVQGTGDLVSAVAEANGSVEREFTIIPAVQAQLPSSNLATLIKNPSVESISLDAPVVSTGFVEVSNLATAYPYAVNAPAVWNATTPRTGEGVTVAVIDSGVSQAGNADFQGTLGADRFLADVAINNTTLNTNDGYGHGTHVAGIIGGDGDRLAGKYIGIAPRAGLIDVKIADDLGNATVGDAIAGVEWVVDHKDAYNIRVLSLSLHSAVAQSYKTDPLDGAVEAAWLQGVVVVVAAGNMGNVPDAVSYAPANDPFVIVVGASDDQGTNTRSDDVVATFSSRGRTQDGFDKPDVVAPGRRIVSDIDPNSILARTYFDRFVDLVYFRMSGTSMSAPVVSGTVALMLQQNPSLTPGQVKYILTKTAQPLLLDPSAKMVLADAATFYSGAVPEDFKSRNLSPHRDLRRSFVAKIGLVAHVLGAPDPALEANRVGIDLSKLGGPGTNLSNVDWNAIQWGAIQWGAIQWGAIQWGAIQWDAIQWGNVKWNAIQWGAIQWGAIQWGAIQWGAIQWGAIQWDALSPTDGTSVAVAFSSSDFDSTVFDSVGFDSLLAEKYKREHPAKRTNTKETRFGKDE